ncbi:MAG: UDP-N-acetylglucosamine--N-acetylmuramyl-(pentapeptide) pyrophosphoryl-undecaprenol N-acetylglucosamine transferase [Elusimicrobiaceae bacterium]|nr:UDP-N-acetylglucosamine--N-acetylmuramyl-(pentapeptide) pyrophosphoryl-undecaprenol N-acetylglucosamine transferase [Elusimicrobiaceae bacterium]
MLGLPTEKPLKKAVLTSTPIRREFTEPVDRKALLENLNLNASLPTALVVGGSQGAHNLNQAIVQATKQTPQWQFIHISGERWYNALRESYRDVTNVAVLPYSHEIYALMKAVDLIVCRSGASTLAEVIYCHLPAILVPFAHAAANHQYYNAKILQEAGCATLICDAKNPTPQLCATFKELSGTAGNDLLRNLRQSYQTLAIPNPMGATKHIIQLLCKL